MTDHRSKDNTIERAEQAEADLADMTRQRDEWQARHAALREDVEAWTTDRRDWMIARHRRDILDRDDERGGADMSAETLREAAKVLRERAEAATPWPWGWHKYGRSGRSLSTPGPVIGGQSTHELNVLKTTDDWPPTDDDARFIATMHPGVALALAGWLDQEVAALDLLGGSKDETFDPALRVAEAILGGLDEPV